MAFLKNTWETTIKETKSGADDGKISIPMVITKEGKEYHGFVPGIVMQDIVNKEIDACKAELDSFTKKRVKNMIVKKVSFPNFPTNQQIKENFEGVVLIKRILVRVNY